MTYPVKLQTFEGPLDLLLHLIDKAEVSIYDIPIAEITDQYLNYLYSMQEFKIDVASEFIVMAATLLLIKSKTLLPKPETVLDFDNDWLEEEEDPREDLVKRLIEYKRFKMVSELLQDKEFERNQVFTRPAEDLSLIFPQDQEQQLGGLSILQLLVAFQNVWNKRKEEKSISTISKEEISVNDKIDQILYRLKSQTRSIFFSQLFIHNRNRGEMVVTFLAILELIKQRKIICKQAHNFSDIEIHKSID